MTLAAPQLEKSNSTVASDELGSVAKLQSLGTFSSEAKRWDSLLRHQVSLFATQEVKVLETVHRWKSSNRILDIGCGNGDYTALLAKRFPCKEFAGLDTSVELINIARRRHAHSRVSFFDEACVAGTVSFAADLAVLRFVVQHISQPRYFVIRLARRFDTLRSLIVIEPDFAVSNLCPEMPGLSKMVALHNSVCQKRGQMREGLASDQTMKSILGPQWTLSDYRSVRLLSERSSWSSATVAGVLSGWLVELSKSVPADLVSASKAELKTWLEETGETLDLGLHMWIIDRSEASQ